MATVVRFDFNEGLNGFTTLHTSPHPQHLGLAPLQLALAIVFSPWTGQLMALKKVKSQANASEVQIFSSHGLVICVAPRPTGPSCPQAGGEVVLD